MTIAEILKGLNVKRVTGPLEKEIEGIAYDSRIVKKGFLFVAIKGLSVDGHAFIKDVISKGAAGVVTEKAVDVQNEVAVIEVDDSRDALALMSAAFYRDPSKKLSLIGITGTNGKTTTSYITKNILEVWGKKVGLLGTVQYIVANKILPASHTTPESLDLQGYLREMVDNNIEYGVIEVSSHALALKRVKGCSFRVAVFTNFSQDHLDFHGTMEDYFAAKAMLFDYLGKDDYAVLNWDDPMVRSLAEKLNCHCITCGLERGAMLRAKNITDNRQQTTDNRLQTTDDRLQTTDNRQQWGLSFMIQTPEDEFLVRSELIGRNNIYNILMSAGAAYALGVSREAIIEGIRTVKPIEGRLEKIDAGQNFLCIVDYAHTEDALKKLIEEARLITGGKIITVFGCGGDRDRTKRPKMGVVASDLSDFVVITSDNPRIEEPSEIIKDIIKCIKKDNYIIEPDRAKAIEKAISIAKTGDTLLIAGKGHENYQEIKGIRYPFSDKEVFKKIIQNAKW
ncbi:MAG TPA: UDP-N-acetylmuramoyl-L-alanyl-D-glutamate--2,6-diaminopimelate ligase [Thermodesulfovibrionia bacterium]|nr:UDP-N-acetylmuramoyl-L-alanyl-D-glutamate--2,6-diaminopimelate ligase [Thermodesulfovibrionia bacterium]